MILLRLLYWVLAPLDALGVRVNRFRDWADRTYRIARALRPGSPVSLACTCHQYSIWYVDRYSVDADDYRLVKHWPERDGQESLFMLRGSFNVVKVEPTPMEGSYAE